MEIPAVVGKFATVVTGLVIVLDPLAIVPVMAGLTAGRDAREWRRLVYRVIAGATVLLLFFTVTGTWVLRLFGVTLNDLRIGGGLLLLLVALRMVVEGRMGASKEEDERAAIVPLISPLLVGPGAITAAVVLAAIHGVWFTALAALVSMLICLVLFLSTRVVQRVLGESGTNLVTRVMGILVATIAVSYIRDGIFSSLKGFSRL
ncbi:MAG: MarC family protein [Armatimonadetes bacterium]|nr:MarC family protein [Armatimonadota bacterium]